MGSEPWAAGPHGLRARHHAQGPIGGAAFNNEFGRPALAGYFRSFELAIPGRGGEPEVRGYHRPIMIAGGFGNIRREHVDKGENPHGAAIVVLGGPAMLIGLGGGAASSVAAGTSHEDLDYASVQRDNPEMQRRCQEVIDPRDLVQRVAGALRDGRRSRGLSGNSILLRLGACMIGG